MKTFIWAFAMILFFTGCNTKPENQNPPLAPTEIVADTVISRVVPEANNSLAYLGIYKGTLPCPECSGIETTLQLAEDFSYSLTKKDIGKKVNPIELKGNYSWNKDGTSIILENIKGSPNQFLVGERMLTQLDMDGNVIKGKSASQFILRKMTEAESQKTDAPKSPVDAPANR